MQEARYVSLIPQTTLHSDSEQLLLKFFGLGCNVSTWSLRSSCGTNENLYKCGLFPWHHSRAISLPVLVRTQIMGHLTVRNLVYSKSDAIFSHDRATCQTAKTTTEWLQTMKSLLGERGLWPANSPDLNPIEKLWLILE
jgi:hypothetical protein